MILNANKISVILSVHRISVILSVQCSHLPLGERGNMRGSVASKYGSFLLLACSVTTAVKIGIGRGGGAVGEVVGDCVARGWWVG